MKLIKENGEPAGLWEICEWWIEKYPADIFVTEPKEVVEVRTLMIEILKRKKKT